MYERRISTGADVSPAVPVNSRPDRGSFAPSGAFDVIRRRKGGLAGCALLGVAAALAFSLLAAPRYTASTKIIIDPTDLRITDRSLRADGSSFSDAQIAQVENEVRIITSSNVLGAVVEAEHLDADEEFSGGPRSLMASVAAALGLGKSDAPDAKLKAVRTLAKDVVVKREERTYVVEILVTTSEAAKSTRLADALVSTFLQSTANERTEAARRVVTSLKGRLSDLKNSVEQAERRVEDFKQQNNMVAAVGQSVLEQQLANANTRLGDSRRRVEEARSRYVQVQGAQRSGDVGAVPEALQSVTVGNMRSQLAQVMRKEGDIAATLGPRHPDVAEIRGEERNIRTVLRDELSRIASVARSDLDRALADQSTAQQSFDALKNEVTSKSQSSVRLRELERDVEANRTVYEAFLVRAREVAEQEKIDAANISVISPAQVLEAKAWPPRPLILLLAGLALGLALGVAQAFLRDHLTRNAEPRFAMEPAPQVRTRRYAS